MEKNMENEIETARDFSLKLLVSPLITPIVVPYIIPYITPCKEFRPATLNPKPYIIPDVMAQICSKQPTELVRPEDEGRSALHFAYKTVPASLGFRVSG